MSESRDNKEQQRVQRVRINNQRESESFHFHFPLSILFSLPRESYYCLGYNELVAIFFCGFLENSVKIYFGIFHVRLLIIVSNFICKLSAKDLITFLVDTVTAYYNVVRSSYFSNLLSDLFYSSA